MTATFLLALNSTAIFRILLDSTPYSCSLTAIEAFRCMWMSQSQSHITTDRQSASPSLVSGAHLGPATNFSFSLKFYLESCGFVILYALSDEKMGP
jgi:hypothetical protein